MTESSPNADDIEHPASSRGLVPLGRRQYGLDPWQTAEDDLDEMGLLDVLNSPGIRGGLDADDDSRQQIRLHEAPPGFRALMGKLADELFLSYSGLCRVSLGHGIAVLEAKAWMRHLRSAYADVGRKGINHGDVDAMTRLDATVKYAFQQPRPVSTTLDASRATAARISDLARICGVPRAAVAVIAIAMSVLTLANNRGYRRILETEVDAFRRWVVRRTRELNLGDVQ